MKEGIFVRISVLQSNYIPWKGYFDIIHDADLFIFYDDLQYTKNDWRNRNKIITPDGLKWLTIPVGQSLERRIMDVTLPDPVWQRKHFSAFQMNYARAPYYKTYLPFLEHVYLDTKWETLVDLDRYCIQTISREFLGMTTQFTDSLQYHKHGVKHEALLSMLKEAGATRYISGPAAQDYIVEKDYADAGIELVWKDYSGYPDYPQQFGAHEHGVSILDLLLNVGPDAPYYIWGWREDAGRND